MSGRRRAGLSLALLLGALVLPAAAAQDETVTARAFAVRHRELADAAEVVEPLLSPAGSLTLRPRTRVLVVQDQPFVLDRVAALLADFDIPPRNVEVTLSLFLGSDRRPDAESSAARTALSTEVRGVLETLGDFTKWNAYEPLGSRSVSGVEGDELTATLTDDYRVLFAVETVDEGRGVVRLRRVVLQRRRAEPAGAFEDLYAAGGTLKIGRLHVIGAASDPHSRQALFLTVRVEAR